MSENVYNYQGRYNLRKYPCRIRLSNSNALNVYHDGVLPNRKVHKVLVNAPVTCEKNLYKTKIWMGGAM